MIVWRSWLECESSVFCWHCAIVWEFRCRINWTPELAIPTGMCPLNVIAKDAPGRDLITKNKFLRKKSKKFLLLLLFDSKVCWRNFFTRFLAISKTQKVFSSDNNTLCWDDCEKTRSQKSPIDTWTFVLFRWRRRSQRVYIERFNINSYERKAFTSVIVNQLDDGHRWRLRR